MRILIPLVSSFGKPGGWRVISELANSWINDGHEVYFLAPDDTDPYFPTSAEILYYDYSGRIVSKEEIQKKRKTFIGPFENRRVLRKAIEAFPKDVDVLLATHNFTALPVSKAKLNTKKFYYIQAYEPEYYEKGPIWYKIYEKTARRSYHLQNLIKIVNADMYKDFKEIKTDKVVYPGINTELFSPSKNKMSSQKLVLGTIGRTEVYKGTSYILEAFRRLRDMYGDKVELHIAFGDADWAKIEGVKMFFPEDDAALADYYRTLDVYLCAGLVQLDAIHYPVLESMATKVPLITTGYYPSHEENCYLVPVKNVDALVSAVEKIITHPEEAHRKAEIAYSKVHEFSWKNISGKMLEYFMKA